MRKILLIGTLAVFPAALPVMANAHGCLGVQAPAQTGTAKP